MSVALRVYEQLTDAVEDKERARAIADGFEQPEERYAPMRDAVTQGQLRETELRLQKEIREVELKLMKEIEGVRLDIKPLEVQGEKNRADLVRWVVAVGMLQSALVIGVQLKTAHLM